MAASGYRSTTIPTFLISIVYSMTSHSTVYNHSQNLGAEGWFPGVIGAPSDGCKFSSIRFPYSTESRILPSLDEIMTKYLNYFHTGREDVLYLPHHLPLWHGIERCLGGQRITGSI